jgi:hypothetical protein
MNGVMKLSSQLKSSKFVQWSAVLMVVAAIALFGLILRQRLMTGLVKSAFAAVQTATPDVADTQPEDEVTSSLKLSTKWTTGNLTIVHGQLSVVNGKGKFQIYIAGKEISGDMTTDESARPMISNVPNWIATSDSSDGDRSWKAGALWGITHNGRNIGVLNGSGEFDYFDACTQFEGNVAADGHGGYIYSATKNWPATCQNGTNDAFRLWNVGAIYGITHNGHAIGVIIGTGKLQFDDFLGSGAHVSGDVTADGKGGFIYSNVKSATTTADYWDGVRRWKAGAVLGVLDSGKSIGVLSGTGKLDYVASGAHITGDVTADGKGGLTYSNVTNGTTTSEYWDGAKLWRPGAVLGVKGRNVEVMSGTGKLDFLASGAHVTGDVTADGKGGFIYKNVTNGTTTSEFWDGVKMWKPGAVIGVESLGKAIGVINGTAKVD